MADNARITSYYMANKIIDHVLRNTAYTPTASVYIALFTGSPTRDWGTGTEVAGGSYARQTLTKGFSIASSLPPYAQAWNTNTIVFPTSTADWGTIVSIGVMNALTGGSVLFSGICNSPKTIYTGDTYTIGAGNLSIFMNYDSYIIEGNNKHFFTVYSGSRILNHVLNNNTYTTPGTDVYIALYNTTPDTSWNSGDEVSGTGYGRMKISGSSWTSPINGSSVSLISLVYPQSYANNWGTIMGASYNNSLTGGSNLICGPLSSPVFSGENSGIFFPSEYLSVKIE